MNRQMIYALAAYLFAFLVGMNIFVSGIAMGLAGGEFFAYTLPTFVPAVFFIIYFFRANIGNLERHEKLLQFLIYASVVFALLINSIFFIPTLMA